MGVDFKTLDSRSLSQLCQDIQGEPAQVAVQILRLVAKRLGIAPSQFTFNIMPYGTDLGPSLRNEWSQLVRNAKGFYGTTTSAAVAANFSQFQLFNLAGSGRILLVVFASVEPLAAMECILTADTVQAATAIGPGSNLRLGSAVAVGGSIRSAAAAAVSGTVMYASQNGANNSLFNPNLGGFIAELPEGTGLSWWGNTVNQGIKGTFMWAEVDANYPR